VLRQRSVDLGVLGYPVITGGVLCSLLELDVGQLEVVQKEEEIVAQ